MPPPHDDDVVWFEEQVDRYERLLLKIAYLVVGDREAAQDVVQDTFLSLCRRLDSLDRSGTKSWLVTVCRNKAIDWLRRRRPERVTPAFHDGSHAALLLEDALVRERDAPDPQGDFAFARMLRPLEPRLREVVLLRFEGDLSYREIAAIIGCSEGNVGTLIHNAVAALRESFGKESLR